MRGFRVTGLAVFLTSLAWQAVPVAAAASCDSLAALTLPQTTITLANLVEPGAFRPFPAGRGGVAPVAATAARAAGAIAAAAAQGRGGRGGGAV